MTVFGQTVPERLPEVIGRVGAIVEQPKFFPGFSGRKNLTMLARAIDAPTTLVDVVLSDVGLLDRAGDRYKGYSLGMKQRLAIAATLLKDPDLLIFDEPTNGLDPAGIRRDPRHHARARRPRQDRPGVQPHPGRGGAGGRHGLDHRPRRAHRQRHRRRPHRGRHGRHSRYGPGRGGRRAPRAAGARRPGVDGPLRGAVPAWSTAASPRPPSPRRSPRNGCSSTSWCRCASTWSPSSSS